MDKDEFERIKAEEKAHLQQLRNLKRTHRSAQRTASTAKALNAITDRTASDNLDAATDKLMRDAAHAEARFDLALEGDAPVTGNADGLDRADLAKAEAEAMVRQMKVEMGARDDTSMTEAARAAGDPAAPADAKASPATGPGTAKTIGRTPPPADLPPPVSDDAKTIGAAHEPATSLPRPRAAPHGRLTDQFHEGGFHEPGEPGLFDPSPRSAALVLSGSEPVFNIC